MIITHCPKILAKPSINYSMIKIVQFPIQTGIGDVAISKYEANMLLQSF